MSVCSTWLTSNKLYIVTFMLVYCTVHIRYEHARKCSMTTQIHHTFIHTITSIEFKKKNNDLVPNHMISDVSCVCVCV